MSTPELPPRRGIREVLRYVLGLTAGAVILLLLLGKRADLAAAAHQLGHLDPVWLAAGVNRALVFPGGMHASLVAGFTVQMIALVLRELAGRA